MGRISDHRKRLWPHFLGNSIKGDFAYNDVIDKAVEYSVLTFHVICKRYLVIERISLYFVNYCIIVVQITFLYCFYFSLYIRRQNMRYI